MGKAQEIYAQILELEKEWCLFSEETATDKDRYRIYPKKLTLSNLYCDLAKLIEIRQPKESLYCYWRAFCLTSRPIACGRVFEAPIPLTTETGSVEELHRYLERISPEENKFLDALQYILGAGRAQNTQHGLSILRDELLNYAHAQYYLGSTYMCGYAGVPKDDKKAAKYLRQAMNLGHDLASNDLGHLYWDSFRGLAVYYFELGVMKGNIVAQFNLAGTYEFGSVGSVHYYHLAALQGYMEARDKLTRIADEGNAFAQFYSGEMFEFGYGGFAQNIEKAVHYYHLAALQGYIEARDELTRIADEGNASAQFYSGEMHKFGYGGFAQNIEKAVYYYHLSALQGDANARNSLIELAAGGNALAQFRLAVMYELGEGELSKDLNQAFYNYQRAAGCVNPVSLNQSNEFYLYLNNNNVQERVIQFLDLVGECIEQEEKACLMLDFAQFLWTDDEKEIRPHIKAIVAKHPWLLERTTIPVSYVVAHGDAMMAHPAMKIKRSTAIRRVFSYGETKSIRDRLTRATLVELLKNAKNPDTIRELETDSNLMALLDDSDKVAIMLVNEQYETVPENIENRFLSAIREAASKGLKGGKTLLSELYKRGSIPVCLSDLPLLLQDKKVFENEQHNPAIVYFESIKQHILDGRNSEVIYCVLRMMQSEMHLSEFLKYISLAQLVNFIKQDENLSVAEKNKYISRLLHFVFSQPGFVFTPLIVDLVIEQYKENPGYLIKYLKIERAQGGHLFLERIQENKSTEEIFKNAKEGVVHEAFASLYKGEEKYAHLLQGLFSENDPSTPDSTLQFLESLPKEQKDNPQTMFKYEAMTLDILKKRCSVLPTENQEAILENLKQIISFFSENNAGILLQIELFFIYQRMGANETLMLECLKMLENIFQSLKIKLSKMPDLDWKNKFSLDVKEKLEAISEIQTEHKECQEFIGSHRQEWTQRLDCLPLNSKKPAANLWESAAVFFGKYPTLVVKDSVDNISNEIHPL